jgi:O-antigen/teichoic acid export membrane protein
MLSQAATLLSLVILARLVPKHALGGYQQLWLIYGILSPFLVGGVPTALLYFIPRSATREEISKWVRDAYLLLAAFGIVSSLAVFVLRRPIAAGLNDPPLAHALLFYVPYPFFAFLNAAMPSSLIASGRARLAAVLNAANGVVTVAAVVAAAVIRPTSASMAVGLSVSAAILAVVSTTCVVRALGVRGAGAPRTIAWRPLLAYGLPLALTQLAGMIGFQFDRLVISHRYAPSVFAVYALGAVEVPVAIVVQQAVNSVLVPALSRLHAEGELSDLVRQWHAAIRKVSLVILPLFAFLLVMAGSVIAVLYGDKFGGSVRIFRAYLFVMPLRMATYGIITQAMGRTGVNLAASVITLVANIALAVALVFPLGLLGPAIATPLAMLLTVVFYVVRLRGVFGLSVSDLVPWRLLLVNAAIALTCAAPLLALLTVRWNPEIPLVLGAVYFLPAYLAALRVTGRLTPMEWRLLRARLPLRAGRVSPA